MNREIGGYRILGPLGRGGMGAVYRAVDGDGHEVALKLLHPHLAADAEPRERLRREVANLHRIRHRAVARVLDAEVDSAEAFVVTELVDGMDLAERVRTVGPLEADELAELGDRLREALDVVHAAGVLHRDLTPGNVMLTDDGPVLIDFGIAQAVEDPRVTSVGLVAGTPGYVAPELLDGGAPSRSADWWGWAALLTFAATGRPPFGTGPAVAVLARTRAGEADLAGLDARTRSVLRAALQGDSGLRPPPERVTAELHAAASGRAAGLVGPPPPPDDGTQATEVVGVSDGRTRVLGAGRPADDDLDDDDPYDDRRPGLVGYDRHHDADDDPASDGYPPQPDGWDGAVWSPWPPPPEPPRRGGVVLLLGLALVALGATRPGVALVAALAGALVVRSVGLDAAALSARRQRRGPSRGDRARAVLTWPWHLVRAVPGVVAAGVIAVAVAVAVGGLGWWLLSAGHVTVDLAPGEQPGALPGNPAWVVHVVLAATVLLALLAVWFGPVAGRTRVGARWALADRRWAAVVVLVVAAGVGVLTWSGADVIWWPLPGPPDLG